MKKCLITIIVILLGACQPKDYRPNDLHRWVNNYMADIRSANIEGLLSYDSDNIRYFPPNQPSFSGKDNLRKWFLTYFNYYDNISEKIWIRDLQANGDFAYIICNYTVSARVKHSGDVFKDSGKLINFFKRNFGGEWVCTHSMWNSDNRTFDLHSEIPAEFSGTWKLDLSRTTDVPDIVSSTVLIVQNGNEISINRSYEMKNKEPLNSSFKCTIGSNFNSSYKNGSITSTSFWSTDKQSFTIIETIVSENNGTIQENKRTTIYAIVAKGETLSIISDEINPTETLSSNNGGHIEMIYNRL